MAGVVRHFSSFPFDVRSDAIEIIDIWRHVLVKGEKDQIDRFLDEVSRRFEGLGWSRDTVVEDQMNRNPRQINRFYCWIRRSDPKPWVRLCLNRATDGRVRGGTYYADERAGLADLAGAIQRVLGEVLEPAADVIGLAVSYPRLGPISRVGPKTAAAMTALAEAGDGQWPLPNHVEPFWKSYVCTAFRDHVAISPEELTAWFIANGWAEDAADELTKRFYSDVALLQEHEEAGRQPA